MEIKRKQNRFDDRKIFGVYLQSVLTQKIVMLITEVGNNLKQNLEEKLKFMNEGKCIIEGFVRPKSIKIISYSSGIIYGDYIEFIVVFECAVCHPVEGMLIEHCKVKSITKAGIHAIVETDDNVIPLYIDVTRDHHNLSNYFNSIVEGDYITVTVIGIRYELNDPHIEVIAQLHERRRETNNNDKPKLYIGGDDDDIDIVE